MRTTIDKAGRIVMPAALRERAAYRAACEVVAGRLTTVIVIADGYCFE